MIKKNSSKKSLLSKSEKISFFLIFMIGAVTFAQFVHPGITHKKSDLDRIKEMVTAKIDPWYASYREMEADSKSSYDYIIKGDASFTELGRDSGVNYGAWNSDIRAAYYNAVRWYVTGDSRHAEKAIEIFKAWSNLTSVTSGGTQSLSGGVGYIMIEAAELIKNTYSGWATADINAFKAMLVYPGYSTIAAPSGNKTFYWMSYQGDAIRHGNQGLSGWRTVMAMGIFLDNEIMYDRALRYIKGLPHRSDDIAYPAGPNTSTSVKSSNDYADSYNVTRGYSIADYGYNELLTNYIWENGQCQESSRDQQHTAFGIGLLTSMSEMAWNQGDDLYSYASDRLLLGLEYNMRYNVSAIQSYPDQTTAWNPTVATNEFVQRFDKTGRWYSKAVSPIGIGDFAGKRPVFEMPVAHFIGRGIKTEEEVKWTVRARDKAIEISSYEAVGWSNDALGWGALTARRPEFCYGDPISGFDANGLPEYNMNEISNTIEAENFDYFVTEGQNKTYYDATDVNTGIYRADENVDIKVCSEGGYAISQIQDGEWLSYTVNIPSNGTYDLEIRYASTNGNGNIQFNLGGEDVTTEVSVPNGGSNSIGLTDWKTLKVGNGIKLSKGVQAMKVLFSGADNSFELNHIVISLVEAEPDPINLALRGVAEQSSNRPSDGFAFNAIDGNTNGTYGNGSVSHTSANATLDPKPWWYVDLKASYSIETITIFNRTDCCKDRLNNFTVEVIDAMGIPVFSQFYETYPNPSLTIATGGVIGNYVRISKTSSSALALAEVEVYGVDKVLSTNKIVQKLDTNIYPNPVTDSFTVTNSNGAVLEIYTVTGNLLLSREIQADKQSIDIDHLNKGVYFVKIRNNGSSLIKKIIKK